VIGDIPAVRAGTTGSESGSDAKTAVAFAALTGGRGGVGRGD
jgi:hypothetical protein